MITEKLSSELMGNDSEEDEIVSDDSEDEHHQPIIFPFSEHLLNVSIDI